MGNLAVAVPMVLTKWLPFHCTVPSVKIDTSHTGHVPKQRVRFRVATGEVEDVWAWQQLQTIEANNRAKVVRTMLRFTSPVGIPRAERYKLVTLSAADLKS